MATRDLEKNQNTQKNILNKNRDNLTKETKQNYKKALKEIRVKLSDTYIKYSKAGKLTLSEMQKFNRLVKLEKEIALILNQLGNETIKDINRFRPLQYEQSYYRMAWSVDQNIGVEVGFNNLKPEVVSKSIQYPLVKQAMSNYKRNVITRTIQAINSGLTQGLGIKEMARQLVKSLNISLNDALRIIRTESHRLIELGHNFEFLEASRKGVEKKMQLISTLDDRTRPQSAQMDGNFSNKEGKFKYPNGQYYIPGNTGNPAWDINDRERSIQIIDDISPQLRRTREDGVIPFKTYREWAKDKGLNKNRYGQILFP